MTITVTDQAPTVAAHSFTVAHEQLLTGTLLSGASDPEDVPLTVVAWTQPAHGTLSVNADGSFVYTAQASFVGTDTFRYTIGDGALTDSAIVTIDVTDQPPVAADHQYAVLHDQPLTITAASLLSDASDPDGDALTVVSYTQPQYGALKVNADGSFTYTPQGGYVGTDRFTYTVGDGVATATGAVTISVTDQAPVAGNDSYSVLHDQTLFAGGSDSASPPGLLAGASDADGDPLVVVANSEPAHGFLEVNPDGTFVYTPEPGYVGPDSLSYTVTDGALETTGVVTLHVTNQAPTAANETYQVLHDQTLFADGDGSDSPTLLANTTDPDGDPLWVVGNSEAAHGTVEVYFDGSFVYTPQAGYVGSDSFTYTISDGAAQSTGTVTLLVTDQAPVLSNPTYEVLHDQVLSADGIGTDSPTLLADATDADGDALYVVANSEPTHGILEVNADGSFYYEPLPGFVGTDSFTYTVSDGALQTTGTVTIDVTDAAPVGQNSSYQLSQDQALDVNAATGVLSTATDADGDPLFASLVSDAGPSHGSLTFYSDGSFSYLPNPGYSGTDSFAFTVSDGALTTAPLTVTLTIQAGLPPASAATFSVNLTQPTSIDAVDGLLADDAEPLTAELVSGPAYGSLALDTDGSFTYTPNSNFIGSDSFSYQVSDGVELSAVQTVTLTAAPVVPNSAYTLGHDTDLWLTADDGLDSNADNANGTSLQATLVTGPQDGTLTFNADGSFEYVPNAHFVGTDSFTFTLTNSFGASTPATVTLTVLNTAPVAGNDTYSLTYDQTLTVDAANGVLSSAFDAEDDALTATLVAGQGPAHGTLTLNADGSFSYTPTAGYTGSDSFQFTVSDGLANSSTATVTLQVSANAPDLGNTGFNMSAWDMGMDSSLTVRGLSQSHGHSSTTVTPPLTTDTPLAMAEALQFVKGLPSRQEQTMEFKLGTLPPEDKLPLLEGDEVRVELLAAQPTTPPNHDSSSASQQELALLEHLLNTPASAAKYTERPQVLLATEKQAQEVRFAADPEPTKPGGDWTAYQEEVRKQTTDRLQEWKKFNQDVIAHEKRGAALGADKKIADLEQMNKFIDEELARRAAGQTPTPALPTPVLEKIVLERLQKVEKQNPTIKKAADAFRQQLAALQDKDQALRTALLAVNTVLDQLEEVLPTLAGLTQTLEKEEAKNRQAGRLEDVDKVRQDYLKALTKALNGQSAKLDLEIAASDLKQLLAAVQRWPVYAFLSTAPQVIKQIIEFRQAIEANRKSPELRWLSESWLGVRGAKNALTPDKTLDVQLSRLREEVDKALQAGNIKLANEKMAAFAKMANIALANLQAIQLYDEIMYLRKETKNLPFGPNTDYVIKFLEKLLKEFDTAGLTDPQGKALAAARQLQVLLDNASYKKDLESLESYAKTVKIVKAIAITLAAAALTAAFAPAIAAAGPLAGLLLEAALFTAFDRAGQKLVFGEAEGSFLEDFVVNVGTFGALKVVGGLSKVAIEALVKRSEAWGKLAQLGVKGAGKVGEVTVSVATLEAIQALHAYVKGKPLSPEEIGLGLLQNLLFMGALEAGGLAVRKFGSLKEPPESFQKAVSQLKQAEETLAAARKANEGVSAAEAAYLKQLAEVLKQGEAVESSPPKGWSKEEVAQFKADLNTMRATMELPLVVAGLPSANAYFRVVGTPGEGVVIEFTMEGETALRESLAKQKTDLKPVKGEPGYYTAEINGKTYTFMMQMGCFAAGTPLVIDREGKAKPIEAFQVGDWVLSRAENDPSGTPESKRVEAVFVRLGRIRHIHVSGQVIRTTTEHPFWVVNRGEWLPASRLEIGDEVVGYDGQCSVVEDLHDTGEYETVYNVRITDYHTYFVGGREWGFSVWAHNLCYTVYKFAEGVYQIRYWENGQLKVVEEPGKPGEAQQFKTPAKAEAYVAKLERIQPFVRPSDKAIEAAAKAAGLSAKETALAKKYLDAVYSNTKISWNEIELGLTYDSPEAEKIRHFVREHGLVPQVSYTDGPTGYQYANFSNYAKHTVVIDGKTVRVDGKAVADADLGMSAADFYKATDAVQFRILDALIGGEVEGYTWHHHQDTGKFELVPAGLHQIYGHAGGRSPGHWAYRPGGR